MITGIEPITNSKSKVFIDEQLAFALYKGELSRYHLKVGEPIKEDVYDELMGKILVKRAKIRAMNLLKSMDRTEQEIRRKLKQNFYPEVIIDIAVEYVRSYHYIDDERYIRRYIDWKKDSKSKRQIEMDLMKKGIKKEMISIVYDEVGEQDELILIRKLLDKKGYVSEEATGKEKQKIYRFLMQKGFKSSDIQQVMKNSNDFNDEF
ncbi:MAG TPA: RecX family transcriptional regulator [Candidatus Merdenecus merdavium]|nr:RecX family transcriptional regulator [Candidatus Merdenecus merdavium]